MVMDLVIEVDIQQVFKWEGCNMMMFFFFKKVQIYINDEFMLLNGF